MTRPVVPLVALLVIASPAPAKLRSANGGSGNAAISANGRYVAFASAASNLVRYDTNRVYDVFVRDRVRDSTERASVGSHGAQANAQTGPSRALPSHRRSAPTAASSRLSSSLLCSRRTRGRLTRCTSATASGVQLSWFRPRPETRRSVPTAEWLPIRGAQLVAFRR